MYLARFSYDVLPGEPPGRDRLHFRGVEVKAAATEGLKRTVACADDPATWRRCQLSSSSSSWRASTSLTDFPRARRVGSDEETAKWMRAFSEILTAPPVVEILRVAEEVIEEQP